MLHLQIKTHDPCLTVYLHYIFICFLSKQTDKDNIHHKLHFEYHCIFLLHYGLWQLCTCHTSKKTYLILDRVQCQIIALKYVKVQKFQIIFYSLKYRLKLYLTVNTQQNNQSKNAIFSINFESYLFNIKKQSTISFKKDIVFVLFTIFFKIFCDITINAERICLLLYQGGCRS